MVNDLVKEAIGDVLGAGEAPDRKIAEAQDHRVLFFRVVLERNKIRQRKRRKKEREGRNTNLKHVAINVTATANLVASQTNPVLLGAATVLTRLGVVNSVRWDCLHLMHVRAGAARKYRKGGGPLG